MSSLKFRINRAYSFLYPRHNFHGVPQTWEVRRLLVTEIRDTAKRALDPVTKILNPMLRRGRILIIGTDLDKGEERSFYVDSMNEVRRIRSEPPEFAVVDRSSLHERTDNQTDAMMFACGRGGDAVAVRLLSPKLSPKRATSRKDRRRRVS